MSPRVASRPAWVRLVPLGVLAFYALNLDTWLGSARYNPQFYQVAMFVAVAGLAFALGRPVSAQPSIGPMLAWISGMVFLSTLSAAVQLNPEYAVMGARLMVSTIIMVSTWIIATRSFLASNDKEAIFRTAILSIFAVACSSVIFDPILDLRAYIDPSMVGPYDVSRAGGVFLQPNQAGLSVALLFALVLPRVSPRVAILCLLAALLSIFLTFSRSAQIVVALVILLSVMRGYLPKAVIGLIAGLAALIQSGSLFQTKIGDVFGIDQGSGFLRLTDPSRFYGADAFDSDARTSLVSLAFNDFLNAPLLGKGLGYSWEWANSQFAGAGTHNIYLRYMLEYGVLGTLIWPLFLLAGYRIRNRSLDTVWATGICGAAMVAGLFSHNIPEQGSILVVTIAILTLPVSQRWPQPIAVVRAA